MNPRIAFPFLVIPKDSIRPEGWLIGDPGKPLHRATDVLENWDYARDLEVANSISIDWAAVAGALQLPEDKLRLKVSLIVGTGAGTLPRRQDRLHAVIVDHATDNFLMSGSVSGRTLSGRLRVSLLVTLDAPEASGTVLSPQDRGSKLWQADHDILIEDGGDSRFPVETASFSRIFGGRPHEHAPWYLHWRPSSLQGDFSAGVRLYVNSDHPEWLARVVSGDRLSLQAMMGDVMSQMIEAALREVSGAEDFVDCNEGSVGQQILQWLGNAFPGQEVASVRALMERDPGAFRASLLATSDMGSAD
ncbi:hypothetical protein [Pseudoxanthomonas sp.]|jgi:hypothetical protein|uniref:hypothetical protein n=1 Tax=Pseudoxanthomonas sp. TaxID=1871049 RepID=UPI002E0D20B9|nr:hypothetical protein [Pseudoxanthomonas sp.]